MRVILIISLGLCLCTCSKKSSSTDEGVSDSTSNSLETSVSTVGADTGTTEGGSLQFLSSGLTMLDSAIESGEVHEEAACGYASNKSCVGTTGTIAWNSCTITPTAGYTITMSGGWSEAYSSHACCATGFGASCTVTRSSSGSVATFPVGSTLTTNTIAHTTWDGTTLPASTAGTVISMDGSNTTRTITINGLHRILRGPRGVTWFDHSLATSTDITVTGTRAGNNRQIQGGVITLYHNRAKYNATTTFSGSSKVTWGSSSCCYPTAGTVNTTFTGSLTGTASLVFTSTCGTATFTDTTGSSSTVTLTECQ